MHQRLLNTFNLIILGSALLLLLFSGCPAGRSDQILEVALSGSPETLDPHATTSTLTFQVTRSIYDTLIEPDENGELVGALAVDWLFGADGLKLTIILRSDAYFHDGQPLTARDVAHTFRRIQESNAPRAQDYAVIIDTEIISDYEIIFHFAMPNTTILSTLASGWSAILPAALIDSGHDFSLQPVGSGPFKFDEWVQGSKIALSRHAQYWRGDEPALGGVNFNIITENVIRIQGLLNNSIDVVDLVDSHDIASLQDNEAVTIQRDLSSLAMVIPINTDREPFNRLEVRQALSYAIDKQRVLDDAYGGGVPIATFIDYSDPYYPNIVDNYAYNPQKARQIFSTLTLDRPPIMTLPQNFEPHVRAGEIYQQMLADAGLIIELELVDWPTWISTVFTDADYDLTVIGHTGHLNPFPRFNEYAYTRWSNPQIATLTGNAMHTTDFGVRRSLYATAFEIIAQNLPFVFVGTNYRYILTRSNVAHVFVDTKLDTFDFRKTIIN